MTKPRTAGNIQPVAIDALVLPSIKPESTTGIVSPPFSLGACKTFDEFKMYWAENYNVKVSNEISKLHFESVQTAAAGIEAVLKEFPLAGRYLNKLDVLRNSSMMSTWREHGEIYFNPDCFINAETLAAVIESGIQKKIYPTNMTAFGAGAHEAGHIVEDWLIKKLRSVHTDYRPVPRRLVYEAYQNARLTAEGKGKSLETFMKEIASYATKNHSECLASAISDYITNGAKSAILSRMIWQRLKKELSKVLIVNQSKFWQLPFEEIEKYCLFEDGIIAGIKEDAPDDFKEAWEEEKKRTAEMWEQRID